MCGRFALASPVKITVAATDALLALDAGFDLAASLENREARYNLAPGMEAPVLATNTEARLELKDLQWGLVPHWAKDKTLARYGINARMETVADKPMFRTAFARRRCLVPMSGYYEWQAGPNGKQPFFIHAADDSLLLCAGLWEGWKPANEPDAPWQRTFAVLTGEAGLVAGNVHDRQPVILPPERLGDWLQGSPAEARRVLHTLPETELAFHPVNRRVGSVKNQDADLLERIDP